MAPDTPQTTAAKPGPWKARVDETDDNGSWEVIYDGGLDRTVVIAYALGETVARLIAAAPETTAELERVWDQIVAAEFDDINDDDDLVLVTITAPQARAIRSALSRAKGGRT